MFQNFPHFIVIHTVKGFGIVNKAEIYVFLELSCFFDDPDVGNLISGSSAFSPYGECKFYFAFLVYLVYIGESVLMYSDYLYFRFHEIIAIHLLSFQLVCLPYFLICRKVFLKNIYPGYKYK